jgi:tetratricopeptide (TPR) repeat protein
MREGVELALRIGQHARAEALLLRAEKRLEEEGERAEGWLLSGLSDCRLGQGDLRGAIAYLARAVEVADEGEIEELCRELARLASGPEGDPQVAWLAYERLIERRGLELSLIEPLLELHVRAGNRERLEELATRVSREAASATERVTANMALAMFLIDSEGDARGAVPVLRAVLQDDPARSEARALLSSIYQQQGMHDELADLLQEQFDRARDEQNLEAIADIGLQIGGLYGDRRREASIDAYRAALEWAPRHVGLLRALLARLGDEAEPRERAEVLAALLAAEEGPDAAARALELHSAWQRLDEPQSAQGALEQGLARDPDNVQVRELLEASYAGNEQWRPLAELFERDAARIGGGPAAVGRLKNAATLYREQLDDLGAASGALRKALEIVPDDLSLSGELARNLAAAGRHAETIADLTRLLEGHPAADTVRVDLLRVRAELFLAIEELAQGVSDLEEAYSIAPSEVRARLTDALERQKSAAFTEGAPERERACVSKLVALHDEAGQAQLARDVLGEWVEQDPQDIESLRELLARDQAAARHEDVITSCTRLLRIEPAQARARTAMTMADSAQQLGRPELAREGLEHVYEADSSNAELRGRLRALYEALGERAALAALLLADAADKPKAERPELLQRAAQLYLEIGDAEAALGPLKEASKLDPEGFATQLLMADLNIQLGRYAQADDTLEAAIAVYKKRRTPELGVLYQRKGRLSAAQGDVAEQIRWLNQAMEADRKSGEIAADLADVAMNAGDYDTAMKALRMLTMMDDPSPMSRAVAFLRQAQIAYLRGDPRRAQHWARKAKSLDDGNSEVDQFLAEIGAA